MAQLQPYVLSSWEAEFPDLGVAKGTDGPRVYRRADVELVLRIKHLLFVDGLTIAGAKRRLTDEGLVATPVEAPGAADEAEFDLDDDQVLDAATRRQLRSVRSGLEWILGVLGGGGSVTESRATSRTPRGGGRLKRPSRSAKVGRVRGGRPGRAAKRPGPAKAAKVAKARKRPARGKKKR